MYFEETYGGAWTKTHIITTVIGSYPTQPQQPEKKYKGVQTALAKDIYGFMSQPPPHEEIDPFLPAIKAAVNDQVKAGIDIVADGQVRADMITLFAKHIPGISLEEGKAVIVDQVESPFKPSTVDDLVFVLKCVEGDVGVKGIITGPTTLAYACRVTPTAPYRNNTDPELIMDLAAAQKYEAKALEKAGAAAVQIDEPLFSTGTVDLDIGREAIEYVGKDIQIPFILHVCGELTNVFDKLVEFRNVDMLDHEFAAHPENIQIVDSDLLKTKKKMLGLGVVESSDPTIEKADEVKHLIQTGIERFGLENIWVDPDCGLRLLPRKNAFTKLKLMVQATREIEKEYG